MEVTFSGDLALLKWPGELVGHVAIAWVTVQELIDAGERAKAHLEAERIRREEYAWDQLMCVPGENNA